VNLRTIYRNRGRVLIVLHAPSDQYITFCYSSNHTKSYCFCVLVMSGDANSLNDIYPGFINSSSASEFLFIFYNNQCVCCVIRDYVFLKFKQATLCVCDVRVIEAQKSTRIIFKYSYWILILIDACSFTRGMGVSFMYNFYKARSRALSERTTNRTNRVHNLWCCKRTFQQLFALVLHFFFCHIFVRRSAENTR